MVKINNLELENVKRVRAISLAPTANGLTIIGGKNGQGKTSVLDAIAFALGGKKYEPSQIQREGSSATAKIKITLNNGIIVTREGKNAALKVLDPSGNKSGQKLLDSFIGQFALDLPKFMQAKPDEKAKSLLNIIGVGDKLAELEQDETALYNRRTEIGRIRDQKANHAKDLPFYDGVPQEPVSASELIKQQQDILAKNAANQQKREQAKDLQRELLTAVEKRNALKEQLQEAEAKVDKLNQDLEIAETDIEDLRDESTAELEENIANVDAINAKIRANDEKQKAEAEAAELGDEYKKLTAELEAKRKEKLDLLNGAQMPLDGLSVADGELTYNGQKWDCMSGSEQLKVATAIVRKLAPNCGFVLMDKLEQMDTDTLKEFGAWLEEQNLQIIATRVSTGKECSVIIEDGYVVGDDAKTEKKPAETPKKSWGSGWKTKETGAK